MLSLALVMAALLCPGERCEAQTAERALRTTDVDPGRVNLDPVEIEAFRGDLAKYVEEMKAVANAAGLPSDLAVTQERLPTLTDRDLSVLQAAFTRSPNWTKLPRSLMSLVRHRHRGAALPARGFLPQITANDCATARWFGYTQTDVEIAADFALAADVILEAVPQDLISEIARGIAVGVWAIPQGALRGIEHSYNIAEACDAADFESGVNTKLDDIHVDLATLQAAVDANEQRLKSVQAVQRQIIRLLLTPEGRRAVNPEVLTCTGDDCPSVLACPGGECSFPVK